MSAPDAELARQSAAGQPLRVLITNRTLSWRSGTELYVAELAHALLARGHTPILYAPRRGDLGEQLRRQSVVVRSSLADMATPPDIIHGHHRVATMTALTRFPGVPVISFAHDFTLADDACPVHPSVRRYVAVDDTNRDRLLYADGVDAVRVEVRFNWFDARRFPSRAAALPARPRRALVFSNQAVEDSGFLPVLRAACARFDIELDVAGLGVGRVAQAPEAILGTYDIVFAKARAAIESMASGCATILCDAAGFGGLVTADRVAGLRRLNFGLRSLRSEFDEDLVAAAIAAYDPADAAAVSDFVREHADMDTAVDGLVELYRQVISEAAGPPAERSGGELNEARAVSGVFEAISTQIMRIEDDVQLTAAVRDQLAAEREGLLRRLSHAEAQVLQERLRADAAVERAAGKEQEFAELAHLHHVTVRSTTFRVRDALARRRWLLALWRTVRGRSTDDAARQGRM